MKYLIGSKVKVVSLQKRGRIDCKIQIGREGVITNIRYFEGYLTHEVFFEDELNDSYWWFNEENLELVEDVVKVESPKYKHGDIVKFIKYSDDEYTWEKYLGLEVGDITHVDGNSDDPSSIRLITKTGEVCYTTNDQIVPLDLTNDNNTPNSTEKVLYSPLNVQQAGDHYKKKGIQPIEYGFANNLSFPQINIVKYISRHEDKNGLDDLAKSIHYHFFEALRVYGEQGSDELRNKVLALLYCKQEGVL